MLPLRSLSIHGDLISVNSKKTFSKTYFFHVYIQFGRTASNHLLVKSVIKGVSHKRAEKIAEIFIKVVLPFSHLTFHALSDFSNPEEELNIASYLNIDSNEPLLALFIKWVVESGKAQKVTNIFLKEFSETADCQNKKLIYKYSEYLDRIASYIPWTQATKGLEKAPKAYLIHVLIQRKTPLAQSLINAPEDLEAEDNQGNSPISTAKKINNFEMVLFLQNVRFITEHQLEQLACLTVHDESNYMCYLYSALGGTKKKIEAMAQLLPRDSFKITSDLFKKHTEFAIHGFLICKRKRARRFLRAFVTWTLINKISVQIKNEYLTFFRSTSIEKWKKRSARRISDYLSEISYYLPIRDFLKNDIDSKASQSIQEAQAIQGNQARGYVIHDLIIRHRNSVAKALIRLPEDLEAKDWKGNSLLITASRYGNLEMVEFLLEFGADIEQKGEFGSTPVYHSIQQNHYRITDRLIEEGANLYYKNELGCSALMYAVQSDNLNLVNRLLGDSKHTSLHNFRDIMQRGVNLRPLFTPPFLPFPNHLRIRADLNERDKEGRTLLYHAYGNPDMVKRLLSHPQINPEPLSIRGTLVSGDKTFTSDEPELVKFANASRLLLHRFALFHEITIEKRDLSLAGIAKNVSMNSFLESLKEYLPHTENQERVLWEKTLEICTWGYSHNQDLSQVMIQAPYGIVAYVAVYKTDGAAHEVSLALSLSSRRLITGNRSTTQPGLHGYRGINIDNLSQTVKKSLNFHYKGGERFFKKITNKLKKYTPDFTASHKTQRGNNCPIVANKLLYRSVLMHLLMDQGKTWQEASFESYLYYKKFTKFDRVKAIKDFLKIKDEIDQFSQARNLSRHDLLKELVIVEPLIEKVFHKCVSYGLVEGMEFLLPYSDFKKNPDRILLNAYLNKPNHSFTWLLSRLEKPTPLSRFLRDLNPESKGLNAFLRKNVSTLLKIGDPDNIVRLLCTAFLEDHKVLMDYLKDKWISQVPDLEHKIREHLEDKFYLEGYGASAIDKKLKQLFTYLGIKNPYNNPII